MERSDGTPRALRLTPGSMVGGDFRVERLLGRGSMGAVYQATQLSTGLPRALKVMSAGLLDDAKAHHRFDREARLGARIPSSGVVHTVGSGTDEATGLKWIAMEYVAGRSLDEWRDGFPPRAHLPAVIQQLLRAVAAAHALGVVHRDLKPGNILIVDAADAGRAPSTAPTVKVLDFGVAKSLHSQTAASTQEGLGTPLWTAPEQARQGHQPAPTADVWALGLLVFWLLTGKLYWLSANQAKAPLADMVLELVNRPLAPASARATELGCAELLPDGFDAWFARCVVRDPTARFRNGGAALDTLAPVLGLQARRRGLWARVRGLHQASPGMVTAAAVVFVVLAAAVAVVLARHAGLI